MNQSLSISSFRTNLRRFSLNAFILILSLSITYFGLNFYVDSYGVFRSIATSRTDEPNQRIAKLKHLFHESGKFDGFLFGSSRSGKIDVALIGNYNVYNLASSVATPSSFLKDFRVLINHGFIPKIVFIGLDDFSYRIDPQFYREDKLRSPYPSTLIEWLVFLKLYVFPQPLLIDEFSTIGQEVQQFRAVYEIENRGVTRILGKDEWIEQNRELHSKDQVFQSPTIIRGDFQSEQLESLKKMMEICKNNKIDFKIFINPVHIITLLNNDFDSFLKFKRNIANLTDFLDFSSINRISTDNYYWYESSHSRQNVGKMIANSLDSKSILEEDFGELVNIENVDDVMKRQKELINAYLKKN